MTELLQLGEDWALPIDALIGKRVAVLGKSGSGKSNTLAVLAAALLGAGVPVIVVDAMGQFAGLRQVAPVLVAGADEGADVPLTVNTAGFTLAQIGLLTGYSVSGGSFVGNWKLLRERGLVEGTTLFRATEAALRLLGAQRQRPATLAERVQMWRQALPSDGHRRVFDALVTHHYQGISKIDLAEMTNYETGAGRFGEILRTLRNNNLMIVREGRLFANPDLYAEGQS